MSAKAQSVAPEKAPATQQQPELPAKKGVFGYLKYIWIFIPLLPYFNMVNIYAVNLPYQDDYNAILEFLCKFKTANVADKFSLMFSQHVEHRLFFSRIIYVLYNDVFGKVNFRDLIFIGNLELVGVFLLFIYFVKKAVPDYWSIIAIIGGFCLFDLSNYENADFAMCGICNYGAFLFFMLSLCFYDRPGKKFLIPAVIVEVIGIFSSGGGMVGALCIIIFLIFNKDRFKLWVGISTFLLFVPLYFLHYTKASAAGETETGLSLGRIMPFFFHMVGSHFSYENGIIIGIVLLVALAFLLPISLKFEIKPNTLPLLCILCFIFGSQLLASFFRSNQAVIAAYSSRYLIYSHLLVAVMFALLFIKLAGRGSIMWVVTSIAAIIILYSYKGNYDYGEAGFAREKMRLENIPYYYRNDHSPESMKIAQQIEQQACSMNIYCIKDER